MSYRALLFVVLMISSSTRLVAIEPRILSGHTDPTYAAAYTPDGTRLVTASFDKSLRIWDLSSGNTLRTLNGHTALVLCVAMSKDGAQLASGSQDNTIKLWDIPVAKPAAVLQPHQGAAAVAMNADGTQWVTGGADKMLRIWNVADRQLVKEFGPLPFPIVRVAFRADKLQIAAAD